MKICLLLQHDRSNEDVSFKFRKLNVESTVALLSSSINNSCMNYKLCLLFAVSFFSLLSTAQTKTSGMKLNDLEYLEYQGVNVMLAHDFYPESHQGGVGIIQNGL